MGRCGGQVLAAVVSFDGVRDWMQPTIAGRHWRIRQAEAISTIHRVHVQHHSHAESSEGGQSTGIEHDHLSRELDG